MIDDYPALEECASCGEEYPDLDESGLCDQCSEEYGS